MNEIPYKEMPTRVVGTTPLTKPEWRYHYDYQAGKRHVIQRADEEVEYHYEHQHRLDKSECYFCDYSLKDKKWRNATDAEITGFTFTVKNSSSYLRGGAATWYKEHGYAGPLMGGEARCLRILMEDIGKPNYVIQGWVVVKRPVARLRLGKPTGYTYTTRFLRGPVWLFRSPIDGVDMMDFVKLARMYRGNHSMKKAVLELLKKPERVVKDEIKTFGVIEKLAALAG